MAAISPSLSGGSITSVEPAVVNQIVVANGGRTTFSIPSTPSMSASSTKKAKGKPQSDERDDRKGAVVSQEKPAKTRNNSLRRVKNSKEVLRERTSRSREVVRGSDVLASLKEGRNFTVGNVGTGGIIYLRPSINQPQPTTQAPLFVFPPLTPPATAYPDSDQRKDTQDDNRESVWSTSQLSEKLARPVVRHSTYSASQIPSDTPPRPNHGRPRSFSSLDNRHRQSEEMRNGIRRIVIDRSVNKRPKTADMFVLPNLEVPIPHFRLGTPHFSTQGTPILRSSAYTRTSAGISTNIKASTSAKSHLTVPAPSARYTQEKRTDDLSDIPSQQDKATIAAETGALATLPFLSAQVDDETDSHVDPAIFDSLAEKQDDPSVVRYSQRTGDIVAATPARIIAQISSASFMDYELVSDFFLTFRPYMSTNNLLGLLLARLGWAINRLEEDGRIIRIRTFAALRHWILNYFMDDFVMNRKLRLQFCDQINNMYREVQRRNNGGTSDLKILQDLKRCWNGRCSLYWDSEEFVIDNHQEADIVPGGVLGSRDSTLTKLQAFDELQAVAEDETLRYWPPAEQSWLDAPTRDQSLHLHRRQISAASHETSASHASDKSLQPLSCSIPTKALRRSPRLPDSTKQPHPVPSATRRQFSPNQSPSTDGHYRHVAGHSHQRSGSFTDSFRDQSSGHQSSQDVLLVLPHAGSLIRGDVFPPGSPYISVLTTTPTQNEQSAFGLNQPRTPTSNYAGPRSDVVGSAGRKTLMGSIRRALSTRQPVQGLASPAASRPGVRITEQGRKAALPLNISRSNDALRTEAATSTHRTHLRIDLLCAAISQSYQMAQAHTPDPVATSHEERVQVRDGNASATFDTYTSTETYDVARPQRLVSQATAQSGSIMIVDDTGLDIALMSGALPVPITYRDDRDFSNEIFPATDADTSMLNSTHLSPPSAPSVSQRSSGVFARRRSSSRESETRGTQRGWNNALPHNSRRWSHVSAKNSDLLGLASDTRSTSNAPPMLRKSASYPSGEIENAHRQSIDAVTTAVSEPDHNSRDRSHAQAHVLRRRPGGDLRNIQNVHDLDPTLRRDSHESGISTSDSGSGSLLIMGNRADDAVKTEAAPGMNSRVSLIHTHSSQHLRPSFEAVVSGFSSIPDDDDGGLEATLMKLEGKYEKQSPSLSSDSPHTLKGEWSRQPDTRSTEHNDFNDAETEVQTQHRHQNMQEDTKPSALHSIMATKESAVTAISRTTSTSSRLSSIYGMPTDSIQASDDSYNSIPLLERQSMKRQSQLPRSDPAVTIPTPLLRRNHLQYGQPQAGFSPSVGVVEKTDSTTNGTNDTLRPGLATSPTANSFLLEENENLSDLSSELSVDVIGHFEVVARNASPLFAAPGTAVSGLEIPSHPLAHPPSPSSTHRLNTPPAMNPMIFQNLPLTPDPSPPQIQKPYVPMLNTNPMTMSDVSRPAQSPAIVSASSGHLPFVLVYDSELLAEQLTLVEKAALSEVDWSDLVNMRWDSSSTSMLNWVDFLSSGDHKGIDLVITRFNIVVKWVLSEIVLTQNIRERAQTIMKFIHVAAHARRLHNYATMLQITIALTSTDCTRLKKTWELVSPPERSLLMNMEILSQPLRNFHDLRVEMETADLTEGCIPFVGLYIHDLTYNAQKPAEIAGAHKSEPLINFERYRTTATIVKGLLRLIDASSKFTFPPIEGVIDRCLWLAALGDDRIQALSKSVES